MSLFGHPPQLFYGATRNVEHPYVYTSFAVPRTKFPSETYSRGLSNRLSASSPDDTGGDITFTLPGNREKIFIITF